MGDRFSACLQCTQHCYRTHGQGALVCHAPSFYSIVMESLQSPSSHSRMQIPPLFVTGSQLAFNLQHSTSKPFNTEASLEGPSGQIWTVTVEGWETESLWFTWGWRKFAVDHCLSRGDLIVFKLISNSLFCVQIFGNDGCEKLDALNVQNSGLWLLSNTEGMRKRKSTEKCIDQLEEPKTDRKKGKLAEVKNNISSINSLKQPVIIDLDDDEIIILDGEQCSSAEQSVPSESTKGHSRDLSINVETKKIVHDQENHILKQVDSMIVKSSQVSMEGIQTHALCHDEAANETIDIPVTVSKEAKSSQVSMEGIHMHAVCHDEATKENMDVPVTVNKEVKSSQVSIKGIQTHALCHDEAAKKNIDITVTVNKEVVHDEKQSTLLANNSSGKFIKQYMTEVFVSLRRAVSDAERERAVVAAKSYKSNRPFVRKMMKESHVYRGFWLSFPIDFSNKYLPNQTQSATLVDSSGETWTAKWLGNRANPGLSGGWRKFSLDHGLEEGDMCIFELMDRKKLIIKVHIFRVVESALTGRNNYMRIPASGTNRHSEYKDRQRPSLYSNRKMRGALFCKKTSNTRGKQFGRNNVPVSGKKEHQVLAKIKPNIVSLKGKKAFERHLEKPEQLNSSDRQLMGGKFFKDTQSLCTHQEMSLRKHEECSKVQSRIKPSIETEYIFSVSELDANESETTVASCEDADHLTISTPPKASELYRRRLKKKYEESTITREIVKTFSNTVYESCQEHRGNDCDCFKSDQAETVAPSSSKLLGSLMAPSACTLQDELAWSGQCEDLMKPCYKLHQIVPSNRETISSGSVDSSVEIPVNEVNAIVGEERYYDVQRLLNRRKGKKEEEFLVQLTEQVPPLDRSEEVQEESGAWWIPLSYFTTNKLSCHL